MGIIKERAKKIKKELNIAHHEALDIAAQSEHWKNYKSISIKDEAHARSLISRLADYQHIKDTNYYLNKYNYYLKEKGGKNV